MNNSIELDLPEISLYTLEKKSKKEFFLNRIINLFKHHQYNCKDFNKMMNSFEFNIQYVSKIEDLPFLPVRLFKMHQLLSVSDQEVVKTMTSSGTS